MIDEHFFNHMRPCKCNKKFNLPMMMSNEALAEWWGECDFCGNKTKKYSTEEVAEFKWNEFQFKRSLIKEDPIVQVIEKSNERIQPIGVPWS